MIVILAASFCSDVWLGNMLQVVRGSIMDTIKLYESSEMYAELISLKNIIFAKMNLFFYTFENNLNIILQNTILSYDVEIIFKSIKKKKICKKFIFQIYQFSILLRRLKVCRKKNSPTKL